MLESTGPIVGAGTKLKKGANMEHISFLWVPAGCPRIYGQPERVLCAGRVLSRAFGSLPPGWHPFWTNLADSIGPTLSADGVAEIRAQLDAFAEGAGCDCPAMVTEAFGNVTITTPTSRTAIAFRRDGRWFGRHWAEDCIRVDITFGRDSVQSAAAIMAGLSDAIFDMVRPDEVGN